MADLNEFAFLFKKDLIEARACSCGGFLRHEDYAYLYEDFRRHSERQWPQLVPCRLITVWIERQK